MILSFIANLVLANLLTPNDFGCIGLLAIFIALSQTFIDGGFGAALIQKNQPTQDDFSTIFFWNIGLSIIIYSIIYLCAPLVAGFYEMPILTNLLRVQAIILIINAFVRIISSIL
jgi:O-antigen/teichoic acid export membrane protein